ncbi:hypothetical protein [Christensenella timonensis]|uniref:hypothetical protein n=1 Tax=Christensenella timonensis TaxID=1816678 RepID=UPI00082F51AE|nr:hypothetical protein [Christensenella timonensis]
MSKKGKVLLIVILAVIACLIVLFLVLGNPQATNLPLSPDPSTESSSTSSVPGNQNTAAPSALSSPAPVASQPPLTEDDPVDYEGGAIQYQYYDLERNGYETASVDVSGESTLKYGLEVIAQQIYGVGLADSPIDPQSITLDNGNLTIDFKPEIKSSLGAANESVVLDAIADLYLNNVEGVKAVYFGIDGGGFITENIELFRNEPYRTK